MKKEKFKNTYATESMHETVYIHRKILCQPKDIGNFGIIINTLLLMMLWHHFIGVSDILSRIPSPANVRGKIKGNGENPQ